MIGKGTVAILSGRFLFLVITGIQAIFIPYLLGPVNMGYYSYWMSVFLILSTILGLGAFPVLSRYLPELKIKKKHAIVPLVTKLVIIKIPVLVISLLAGYLLWRSQWSAYMLIISGAAVFSLLLMEEAIFYSFRKMTFYALIPLTRILLRLFFIIIFFYFFQARGILPAISLSVVITFVLFLFFLLPLFPQGKGMLDRPFRQYLSFGLWLYMGTVPSVMITWMVIILSQLLINELTLIGYLGLGIQIFISSYLLVSSIPQSILPALVEFHLFSDDRISLSLGTSWKYTNLLLFPAVISIYLFSRPVIEFVIGSQFLPSVTVIRLFIPAVIFFTWTYLHEQVLLIYEKKITKFLVEMIRFLVFIPAALIMINDIGILGGPLALGLASLAGYVLILPLSTKLRVIPGYGKGIWKPLATSLLLGAGLYFFPLRNLWSTASVMLSFLILYILLMWLIGGINKDDWRRIRNIFPISAQENQSAII